MNAKTVKLAEKSPLSKEQVMRLQPYLSGYRAYTRSEDFRRDEEVRDRKVRYFKGEFPNRISSLSEADVTELVTHLWAAQMWGNKQYLAQQIVSKNQLDTLKLHLRNLWDTTQSVERRYDEFTKNVAHLGPAAVTEMMCYIQPDLCGIWNDNSRRALKILGLTQAVNPSTYRITGREYERFNELLAAIGVELTKAGLPAEDLFQVDLFLFQVSQSKGSASQPANQVPSNHDEVRDLVAGIGTMLGFETETEVTIAAGARVDVVWRSRIGNLGTVTYIFEVQSGGSIDSLILNLQKAKSNPTVQKIVAVSDDVQLAKIEKETDGLPGEFAKALAFWRISDVQAVSAHLQSAMAVIEKLGLVPSKSSE